MPKRTHPQGGAENWVLVVAILGSSLAFLDATVINVALPAMQSSLHASGAELQWVVQVYALLLAALLLIGGALGDKYGRRLVFLVGVALFSGASFWCGVAGSIHAVIAARAVQGVGAALLVPESLALITAAFPEKTRGAAIGTWSAASAVMTAIGPVFGGWMVQHWSWRWVFFLNLPLALLTIVLSLWKVPETKSAAADGRLDWSGAALATVGLGAVTFAMIELPNGFPHDGVIGVAGAGLLVAFVLVERRVKNPMVPLGLFASRNFSGANLLTFFLYGGLAAVFYYLPQKLIQVDHYAPAKAGAVLIPITVLLAGLSRWSGALATKFGARILLVAGPLLVGAGYLLMLRSTVGASYVTGLLPGVLVLGLGLASTVAPLTSLAMNSAAGDRAGSASGVNNAVSRGAGVLALAMVGVFFSARFSADLKRGLDRSSLPMEVRATMYAERGRLGDLQTADAQGREVVERSFVGAFDVVLLAAAGLSVAAAGAAAWLVRKPKTPRRV